MQLSLNSDFARYLMLNIVSIKTCNILYTLVDLMLSEKLMSLKRQRSDKVIVFLCSGHEYKFLCYYVE